MYPSVLPPAMENQMEKKIETELKTGVIWWSIGVSKGVQK